MSTSGWLRVWLTALAFVALALVFPGRSEGAETGMVEGASQEVPSTNVSIMNVQDARRSLEAIEKDLRAYSNAFEQVRRDNETAARRHAEALADRLAAIEKELSAQREREAQSNRENSQTLVTAAIFLAVVGVLMMAYSVWFQTRAFNRLAEVLTQYRTDAPQLPVASVVPVASLPRVEDVEAVEASSRRLVGAVEQIERRIKELEQAARVSPPLEATIVPVVKNNGQRGESVAEPASPPAEPLPLIQEVPAEEKQAQLLQLLEKGQSLLSAGQLEKANDCFDTALAIDPNHDDALLRKGMLLERQERFAEALQFYDRAISINRSLTLAYLHKAAVCNQLERFDEALRCYEQALQTKHLTGNNGGS